MIIFKDALSERTEKDEILTDAYKIEEVDSIIYKIVGKVVTETTEVNDTMFGGNASKEGGDEGAEGSTTRGINIVLAHRLVEYEMKKKDYVTHIKGYMKRVKAMLEEKKPEEVEKFTKKANEFVKSQLSEFKEWQFFCGESMDPSGMLVMCKWDGETPILYYFKHGLDEEKV